MFSKPDLGVSNFEEVEADLANCLGLLLFGKVHPGELYNLKDWHVFPCPEFLSPFSSFILNDLFLDFFIHHLNSSFVFFSFRIFPCFLPNAIDCLRALGVF